jgi:type II secretory pathway component PulF
VKTIIPSDIALQMTGVGAVIIALAAAILVAVRLLDRDRQFEEGDAIYRLLSLSAWMGILLVPLLLVFVWAGFLVCLVTIGVVVVVVCTVHRAYQYSLMATLAVSAERLIPLLPTVEAIADERWGLARHRTRKLAALLRAGWTLPDALARVPGLVPRRALVLVRMGHESGLLAASLREAVAERERFSGLRTQLAARLWYLCGYLFFAMLVVAFMTIKIAPQLQKIFADFGRELPRLTHVMIDTAGDFGPVLSLVCTLAGLIAIVLWALWYLDAIPFRLPLLGRLTWRLHTATVLESLALWVKSARPLPEAIAALARWYPRWPVRRRLDRVLADLTSGGDWSESLLRNELIVRSDLAVLRAARQAGNLAWALGELADGRRRRLAYRLQTLLQCVFPLVILGYGLAVMAFVVAFFLPLIALIRSLI